MLPPINKLGDNTGSHIFNNAKMMRPVLIILSLIVFTSCFSQQLVKRPLINMKGLSDYFKTSTGDRTII